MAYLFCATLLTAVLLGAHGYPADPSQPLESQPASANKQLKQSLFGSIVDVNVNTNGSMIPIPAHINFNTSMEDTIGGGASLVFPLVPFPFGLIFPRYPPLNVTVGFNAGKNMSLILNAAAGENSTNDTPTGNSGWPAEAPIPSGPSGWTAPATVPSGWTAPATVPSGWTAPATVPSGWTAPATVPSGWTAPETVPSGWTAPATVPSGWTAPATVPSVPSGWPAAATIPTETSGWKAPATIGKKKATGFTMPNRPNMVVDLPKPGPVAKPQISIADAVAAANSPDSQVQVENVMVENAVNSQTLFTEAALEELAAAEEAENNQAQDLETPSVLTSESDSEVDVAEIEIPQTEILNAASDIEILVPVAVLNVEIPVAPELPQDLSKNAAKSRRHAGVERPSALRIEDFEDVEVSSEMVAPPSPATLEEMAQDVGKEEMILMAMEQGHQIVPGVQLNVARPAALIPGFIHPKPISYQPFQSMNQDDEDSEDDMKNSEMPELSLVGENGVIPKVPTITKPTSDVNSGKNKPRPYGMDPAKNKPKGRPTLESGIKEKEPQHFGLPHYASDIVHKEQMEGANQSVLGWQIPTIKWPSFTNIFQNFLGNRHKGLAKSDKVDTLEIIGQPCVDDEDDEKDIVRSTVIQGGHLCNSGVGGAQSSCETQCKTEGFRNGTCLGPFPTPGCLCSMPNAKEYGLMLTPLTHKSDDLQTSDVLPCKKCGCRESCQKTGSYLGYCVADMCHCAVPWYNNGAA
ncbi:unnamed protein product [Orchesella dallaii]|uniref:Uncharacterized protein n=1 Tax=Orchesella dallaii TaxID=48710 RepID=A0ABP1S1X4_9HEXA